MGVPSLTAQRGKAVSGRPGIPGSSQLPQSPLAIPLQGYLRLPFQFKHVYPQLAHITLCSPFNISAYSLACSEDGEGGCAIEIRHLFAV